MPGKAQLFTVTLAKSLVSNCSNTSSSHAGVGPLGAAFARDF
jgi:hypothetical protein